LSFKNGLQTSVCYEERSGAMLGCQITIIIGGWNTKNYNKVEKGLCSNLIIGQCLYVHKNKLELIKPNTIGMYFIIYSFLY